MLIAELEAKLLEQQRKASQVMRDMYKAHEKGIQSVWASFILNSQSFDEFFTQMAYMNQIKDSNTSALEELNETQKQLEQTKVELEQAKAQADTEAKAASDALAEAQKLREAAQKKADEEAASELAALQQASSELAGGTEESSSVVLPDTSGVNWNTDEASFVAEWSARIDAYLAGSPLEGYGSTFAAAAWKYGVDPRWSPAISNTESPKEPIAFASITPGAGVQSTSQAGKKPSIPMCADLPAAMATRLAFKRLRSTARPIGTIGTTTRFPRCRRYSLQRVC